MDNQTHITLHADDDTVVEQPNTAPGRLGRWACIGLLLVLAVAMVVRLYQLGAEDYWLDEIHSMANSAGTRAEFETLPHGVILDPLPTFTDLTPRSTCRAVWRGTGDDSHPPTYFVVLLGWRRLLGDGEFVVRVLPTLFSVLSILPVALILREYGRPRVGIGVAALLAVTFSHIHMAQQSRPYSLGLLFVSISYWLLVKMEVGWDGFSRRERFCRMLAYGLAVYLAVMTHYFTGFAMLGQVILVAVRASGPLRRAWAITVGVTVAGFAVTWGPQVIGQLDFISQQVWLMEHRPDHWLRTLLRFTDLPLRLLLVHKEFRPDYLYSLGGVILIAGGSFILWRHRCREAFVFAAWYFAPALTFAVIDLAARTQVLSHVRYNFVAAPGLVGLIVLAAQPLDRRLRRALGVGLALAVILTLRLPAVSNPQNRLAAELIAERVQPGCLLVYDAIDWQPFWVQQIYHNVAYYLPEYLSTPSPPFVLFRERPTAEVQQEMTTYDRIVVVSPRVDEVPNPFPGRYEMVDRTQYVREIGFIYLFVRSN